VKLLEMLRTIKLRKKKTVWIHIYIYVLLDQIYGKDISIGCLLYLMLVSGCF